ncbi:MAG: deoxyribodipyrimidine photo-lyase [Verrucomicrobiota bacterium]
MANLPIEPERIRELNAFEADHAAGTYVLYWCSEAQRAEENLALEYAIWRANQLEQSVVVAFGLDADFPEATARSFLFLLEGLADLKEALARRGLKFIVAQAKPSSLALELARDASLLVCDKGYLRTQRAWRDEVADEAGCPVIEIDTELIVPVETASDKAEYAARTIRPKLHRQFEKFCRRVKTVEPAKESLRLAVEARNEVDLDDPEGVLKALGTDTSVEPIPFFTGGTTEAKKIWNSFLRKHFDHYDGNRNQPQTSDVSHMSKYLHYGQISPVYLAESARDAASGGKADKDSFIEELFVRRELAFNFVYYTDGYDSFACLPDWAHKTIDKHRGDRREYVYTREELDAAETHDPYWNAAMREMKFTGYMHNYMRMYWGKKIYEWSADPEEAFATTLALNNRYFLDGRDPNSYTGVAWCYGVHDRPWTERPVFGQLRYMNANGLKAKAKPDRYVEKVDRLVEEATGATLL